MRTSNKRKYRIGDLVQAEGKVGQIVRELHHDRKGQWYLISGQRYTFPAVASAMFLLRREAPIAEHETIGKTPIICTPDTEE